MIETSAFNLQPVVLMLAFLLDMAIGDPRWLPHPVRIIGKAISKTESFLRRPLKDKYKIDDSRFLTDRLKGIFLVILIVGSTFFITWLIIYALLKIKNILAFSPQPSFLLHYSAYALIIYLTATTIATKELIKSSRIVIKDVKNNNIVSAKNNLSMIVGRDTKELSEKGILKATIETLSENLSDGVIAPLFYLAIGGLPLAMAYKAINTLDSMVGYRNDRYREFGWASARLDDIANYIPARISGLLIVISIFLITIFKSPSSALLFTHNALRTMISDGRKHLSPNAGIPEAAMAGALGVRLGGPSTYGGILVDKPYIGEGKREDYLSASHEAIRIIKLSSIIGVTIAGVTLYAKQ